MSERSGIYRILENSKVYDAVQAAFGAQYSDIRQNFVDLAKANAGDKVIDIGCGPGTLFPLLKNVSYTGYEPNPKYVDRARAKFGDRATFHTGYFDREAAERSKGADIVILCAVLHHLDDEQAHNLFGLIRSVLNPSGRLITLDPTFHENQNSIAKFFARIDRGKHVRTPDKYSAIAQGAFEIVNGQLWINKMPPYSYWVMTANSRNLGNTDLT